MKFVKTLSAILVGASIGFSVQSGPVLTEVVETMMEAQANEALFIGQTFGVDSGTTLHFTSTLDPLTRAFSFSTVSNQLYRGLNVSLSTVGTYNQLLGEYNWLSSGVIGNQTWSSIGSVEWVGDPTGEVKTMVTIGNVTVSVRGNVNWEQGPVNAVSSGTYNFESSNGTTWGPFNGRDRFDVMTQEWIHNVDVGKGRFTPDGILTFSSGRFAAAGDGVFDMNIRAVPEPSTLLLLIAAACGLRKTKSGNANRSNKLHASLQHARL